MSEAPTIFDDLELRDPIKADIQTKPHIKLRLLAAVALIATLAVAVKEAPIVSIEGHQPTDLELSTYHGG